LGATGDPQLADFILDRAYFEELTDLAQKADSTFLQGYVALCIDVANLRSCVRASRLDKGMEFLNQVLLSGGNVPARTLATARGDELGNIFRTGALSEAAALGASLSAPGSGALTDFERLCDDAVMDYLGGGRRVAFGEQPIIGYLYAREAEMTAIRTILTGRMAGLDGDTIRQRLRRTYA
jgi:V/A-type H+-transporting ATPase subunit C